MIQDEHRRRSSFAMFPIGQLVALVGIWANLLRIDPEIESLLATVPSQKFVARRYHTTEANLHNWLKKRGLK